MTKRNTKNICDFLASKKVDKLKLNHTYNVDEIIKALKFTTTEIYNEFRNYYVKPKEPTKPFVLFYNNFIENLSEQDKTLEPDKLSTKIDNIWKNMTIEEKEVYQNKYDIEMNYYNEKKRIYNEFDVSNRKIILKITNT